MGAGCCSDNKVHSIRNSTQNTSAGERLDSAATFQDFSDIKKSSLFTDYELLDEIISTENIIERKVRHVSSNSERFVKIYKKELFSGMPLLKQSLLNEYKCLSKLKHPNIIKIHDFYEDPKYVFAVYDYMGEGDMKKYLSVKDGQQESTAYYVLIQIARAIEHMHSNGVYHLDLRPECIKISNYYSKFFPQVVITGFQHANDFKGYSNKNLSYCAPEIIKGKQCDGKVDIWSFGILVFTFLLGYPPFRAKTADLLKEKIKKGALQYEERDWNKLSKQAKQLITDCLTISPKKRIDAKGISQHEWFKKMIRLESTKTAIRKVMVKDMTDNLKHLNMMNYLQQSFIQFIYDNVSNDEVSVKLRQEFKNLDFDDKKVLPRDQVIEVYKRWTKELIDTQNRLNDIPKPDKPEEEKKNLLDGPDEEVKTISDYELDDPISGLKLNKMNKNNSSCIGSGDNSFNLSIKKEELEKLCDELENDGYINYESFISHLNGSHDTKNEKVLRSTFKKLDTNSDGTVTSEELKKLLLQSGNMNEQEQSFFQQIMTEMDTNMDAKITYGEFKTLMQSLLVPPGS